MPGPDVVQAFQSLRMSQDTGANIGYFAKLPRELRDQIYAFALAQEFSICLSVFGAYCVVYRGSFDLSASQRPLLKASPLTRLCKQIRAEAMPFFFTENDFVCEAQEAQSTQAGRERFLESLETDMNDEDSWSSVRRTLELMNSDDLSRMRTLTISLGEWNVSKHNEQSSSGVEADFIARGGRISSVIIMALEELGVDVHRAFVWIDLVWARRRHVCETDGYFSAYRNMHLHLPLAHKDGIDSAWYALDACFDNHIQLIQAHEPHQPCRMHKRMEALLEKLDDVRREFEEIVAEWYGVDPEEHERDDVE